MICIWQFSPQFTEKQAEIVVSDNGKGIAPNHLNNIFNKFYRGNTKSNGSGFGLYIVKETVEKLGGSISVESEVNVGTRFHVVIPNHVGSGIALTDSTDEISCFES